MILLPPIIFIESFSFKKGAFLQNIRYSVVFGIIGTFFFYVIVAGLLELASSLGIFLPILDLLRDAKDITKIRNLSTW